MLLKIVAVVMLFSSQGRAIKTQERQHSMLKHNLLMQTKEGSLTFADEEKLVTI